MKHRFLMSTPTCWAAVENIRGQAFPVVSSGNSGIVAVAACCYLFRGIPHDVHSLQIWPLASHNYLRTDGDRSARAPDGSYEEAEFVSSQSSTLEPGGNRMAGWYGVCLDVKLARQASRGSGEKDRERELQAIPLPEC
jgi:hypothetical protein